MDYHFFKDRIIYASRDGNIAICDEENNIL